MYSLSRWRRANKVDYMGTGNASLIQGKPTVHASLLKARYSVHNEIPLLLADCMGQKRVG